VVIEEARPMRSVLQSLLACFALGAAMTGCGKKEPPAAPADPADVTLLVPAMN
jgi:predicted small lipoprotein YifL